MFDDFRQQVESNEELDNVFEPASDPLPPEAEEQEAAPTSRRRSGLRGINIPETTWGLVAWQRFVLSFMVFVLAGVLGVLFLVVSGKVVPVF